MLRLLQDWSNSSACLLKGLISDARSMRAGTALLLVLWFFSPVFIQPNTLLHCSCPWCSGSQRAAHDSRIPELIWFILNLFEACEELKFLPLSVSCYTLLDLAMTLNSISTVLPICLNYLGLSEVLQLCLMKVNSVICKHWLCTAHCAPGGFCYKYFISHLSKTCFFPIKECFFSISLFNKGN